MATTLIPAKTFAGGLSTVELAVTVNTLTAGSNASMGKVPGGFRVFWGHVTVGDMAANNEGDIGDSDDTDGLFDNLDPATGPIYSSTAVATAGAYLLQEKRWTSDTEILYKNAGSSSTPSSDVTITLRLFGIYT